MMHRLTLPFLLWILLIVAGCAFYPLGMSEAEWNRLTPQQQLEARTKQAELDHERALLREKQRAEQEAQEREQARIQYEQDIARGMIARFSDTCLGGNKCSGSNVWERVFSLRQPTFVNSVTIEAHDNIGMKTGGVIAVYADNRLVADNVDIERKGSAYNLCIGRVVRDFTIRARTDDEVMITALKVFGKPLAPHRTRSTNGIRH